MEEKFLRKDTISFSACIAACDKDGKGGHWQVALRLLTDMAVCEVCKDAVVLSACMTACDNADQWRSCLDLLQYARAKLGSVSLCVNSLGRLSHWQSALRLHSLDPSGAIAACAKAGQWAAACGLAQQGDSFQAQACIRACEVAGRWEMAVLLLAGMVGTVSLNAEHLALPLEWLSTAGLRPQC